MDKQELIDFEKEVACRFEAGELRSPTHLSGGNEDQLLEIFKTIHDDDWKFSTHRNHYHALLSGIPADKVMSTIMKSNMNLMFPEHRFFTSAIVGGILPIAVGVAAALKRQGSDRKVFCFIGDMCASMGIFHEAEQYSIGHRLPITFIVEDNGYSTNSPTDECWGKLDGAPRTKKYEYERTTPHCGTGKWVDFS